MIKEKIIFCLLVVVFIGISVFGLASQGRKKEAKEDLLQDIEMATRKTIAKKKMFRDRWDLDSIMAVDTIDGYQLLLKRSPFFREISEREVKKVEVISIKEEPKKPLFKYKGRVMMGSRIMVIIEDQSTGKSFFVQEGDKIGDFSVSRIDEEIVSLRKSDGEEIILSAVKRPEDLKKDEGLK